MNLHPPDAENGGKPRREGRAAISAAPARHKVRSGRTAHKASGETRNARYPQVAESRQARAGAHLIKYRYLIYFVHFIIHHFLRVNSAYGAQPEIIAGFELLFAFQTTPFFKRPFSFSREPCKIPIWHRATQKIIFGGGQIHETDTLRFGDDFLYAHHESIPTALIATPISTPAWVSLETT